MRPSNDKRIARLLDRSADICGIAWIASCFIVLISLGLNIHIDTDHMNVIQSIIVFTFGFGWMLCIGLALLADEYYTEAYDND